jgi:hypothetical protein
MEKILNSRKINKKCKYLVKWKYISEEVATWQFEENRFHRFSNPVNSIPSI